jgi:hypothetical protein
MHKSATYGQTHKKLTELGWAPCSITNPERQGDYGTRASGLELRDDPAGIYCRPHPDIGCDLSDGLDRQIVILKFTPYGASHRPSLKAMLAVLHEFKLSAGPRCYTAQGAILLPFRYGGEKRIFEYSCHRGYPGEQSAAVLHHAIDRGPALQPGSWILPLDGDWRGGSPLTVARSKFPQFYASDIEELFNRLAEERWHCRPAASIEDDGAEPEDPPAVCDVDDSQTEGEELEEEAGALAQSETEGEPL